MYPLGHDLQSIDVEARIGLIEDRYLWIQQRIRKKELTIEKEPGITNCSDLMTKVRAEAGILKHLTAMGFYFQVGRCASVPLLIEGGGSCAESLWLWLSERFSLRIAACVQLAAMSGCALQGVPYSAVRWMSDEIWSLGMVPGQEPGHRS